MRNHLLLLLLFSKLVFFSQSSAVDSLKTKLLLERTDTTKVILLNDLAVCYMETDFKKCMNYANQALLLAEKIDFKRGIARSFTSIANCYSEQSNYSACLEYHLKALEIKNELGSSGEIALTYNNLGNVYSDLGKNAKALECYEISRKIDEKNNDKKSLTFVYNNIGTLYANKGELKKSIEFLYKSLKLKEELGNLKGAANSANNIAVVYKMLGNYNEAIKFNQQALTFRIKINDSIGMGYSYTNMGVAYRNLKNDKMAEESCLKALEIFKRIKNKKGLGAAYNDLGIIYKLRNQNDKALEAYKKSIEVLTEINGRQGLASAYSSLASLFGKQKNYKEAEAYFAKSETIAKELNGYELLMETFDLQSEYYQGKNDFKTALKYNQLFTSARDSLRSKENNSAIADTKIRYETEKKEAENKLLLQQNNIKTLENEKSKQTIFLLVGGIVLACIIVLWQLSLTRIKKQKRVFETEKKLQQDRERISRDLHDNVGGQLSYVLFSLEGKEEQTQEKRKEKTQNLSNALRNVTSNLRETIWALNQSKLTAQELSDKLKLYTRNMFLYSEIKIKFDEDIINQTHLNPATALAVFRICQEIINNVFKHAKASELTISIKRQDKMAITICDNGIGFEAMDIKGEGFGLNNLKSRATEINASLDISSKKGNGTTITLIV